jgi:hypothetical protein
VPAGWIIIDIYTTIMKMFIPLTDLIFFIAALPYASLSIHNVSEGDLCSKIQHFMFGLSFILFPKLSFRHPTHVGSTVQVNNQPESQVIKWAFRYVS